MSQSLFANIFFVSSDTWPRNFTNVCRGTVSQTELIIIQCTYYVNLPPILSQDTLLKGVTTRSSGFDPSKTDHITLGLDNISRVSLNRTEYTPLWKAVYYYRAHPTFSSLLFVNLLLRNFKSVSVLMVSGTLNSFPDRKLFIWCI